MALEQRPEELRKKDMENLGKRCLNKCAPIGLEGRSNRECMVDVREDGREETKVCCEQGERQSRMVFGLSFPYEKESSYWTGGFKVV